MMRTGMQTANAIIEMMPPAPGRDEMATAKAPIAKPAKTPYWIAVRMLICSSILYGVGLQCADYCWA